MAYSLNRTITIDHTKCGSTNTTDFALLFTGAYPFLKTVGNGGNIQNTVSVGGVTVPADMVFATDTAGSSLLKWEVVSYTASTGQIVAWVKIPTLSASVDTVFYLVYSDAAVTTWQGDINGTWNSSYLFMIHGSNVLTDSTSNARNFTCSSPGYATGKFGTCIRTDTSIGNSFPGRVDTGMPSGTSSRTIKMWIAWRSSANTNSGAFAYGAQGTAEADQRWRQDTFVPGANFKYIASSDDALATFNPTLNQFYYIVCTFNSSGTVAKIYFNGAIGSTTTKALWNTVVIGGPMTIGTDAFSAVSIDAQDVSIRNVVESPDEILAQYNNQNNPSSFYTVSGLGWQFYRTITIDHTKCGASNSTDFPVMFAGTYTYLKTAANGGDIYNASGFDIAFYADALAASILNFELVWYDATTGDVEFWVKVPTVSSSVDTVIYLFYKNSAISTYQGNTAGTWDSDFVAVHHYGTPTSLALTDSTSNGFTGTITGTVVAHAGQNGFGGAGSFDGTTGYIRDNGYTLAAGPITWECWIFRRDTGNTRVPMYNNTGFDNSAPYLSNNSDSTLWGNPAPLHNPAKSIETVAQDTWTRVAMASSASVQQKIYKNGAECTYSDTGGGATTTLVSVGPLQIGAYQTTPILFFYGYIDEVRVSKIVRPLQYFVTSYNNQSSPSTFYAIGAAVPFGGGGGGVGGSVLGRIVNLAVRIH